jgi:hypothetical protein
MLTLFGALNMMAVIDDDYEFGNYAQLTLYRYHNHVKPKVNEAIYKFEFDCEDPEIFSNGDLPLTQFQNGVYFYRPHYTYNGEKMLPLSCKRVTRAPIEMDRGIPKIEVVVDVDPKVFNDPTWWSGIGQHLDMKKYAPKWICENYVTGRFGNRLRYTYIPVLIEAEQRDSLVKARNILDDLVDACYKDIDGVRYHIF